MKTLIVIVGLVVLIANFPKQSIDLGTKTIKAVVALATGSYEVGKTAVNETRTQVTEKAETLKK